MYIGQYNRVHALDAATGRLIWEYMRQPPSVGWQRGIGIYGDMVYMVAQDSALVALDRRTGNPDVGSASVATGQTLPGPDAVCRQRHDHHERQRPGRRLHRGVRRADRKIEMVVELDSEAGRARQRDVGRRFVEKRRRPDLGERQLRSAAQPDLLGHRPADARFRRRQPRRRQPLHRQHRRARHRHRQDEMAFPEHAARRARLGFERDAGAARRAVQRPDAQAAAAGEPQRHLLRARSDERKVSARRAVREQGRLAERPQPGRAPDSDARTRADGAGHEDVPVNRRRDELSVAGIQPRHEAVLSDRAGRLRHHVPIDDEFPPGAGRQRHRVYGEPGRSRALAALRARASTR